MREFARSARRYPVLSLLGCLGLLACGSSAGTSGHGGAGGGTTGGAGTTGAAGTTGGGGSGAGAGTTGSAGTGASAGTTGNAGRGGTSGSAGTTGAAGTTGNAGRGGTQGSAGTTGTAGTTGGAGRGGAGATAGNTGAAGAGGRAGTTGAAGSGGGSTGTAGAPAMPSAGCSATTTPAGGHATIDVSGTQREYILTLPANYDPKHPYRLIIAFHGGSYNAQWLVDGGAPQSGPYYGIQSEANNNAIFVASQALSTSWTNQSGRDIDYVLAMVARFKSELCIDQNRIFATGFSMGGIMTNTVACGEGSIFRAVAAMSGRLPTTPSTCAGDHEIAYWASHGMSDPTIPFTDGETVRDKFVAINHCAAQTIPGDPAGCINYQGCDTGYPVIWCPFAGVHEPPPFAGSAIWRFLSQF